MSGKISVKGGGGEVEGREEAVLAVALAVAGMEMLVLQARAVMGMIMLGGVEVQQ
jgi:hypothetical protein